MTLLRIAQVCADRGIDPHGTKGAAQHLRGVAAGLSSLGHHVRTFTERPTDGTFPTPAQRLAALTTATDIDVVYERLSLGHRGGIDHARRVGVPFVLEVNAPLVDEAERHRPGSVDTGDRAIEIELLRDADLVISVASELAAWISEVRTGPIITQPNGFEPSWFPLREIPAAAGDAAYPLVFLGHPKPWHGANRLTTLLVELARTGHRPDLLIVGGGDGIDWIRAEAVRLGVADQLTTTGALPPREATHLLSRAAIGLAPYPKQSPFYFCPLKIIDYLAGGLAVVSTDQGDIAGMVDDAGLVVDDPDDDRAFADAVRTLLDDDERRAEMAANGRRAAYATMTWRHVAEATATAIADVMSWTATRR